MTAYSIEVTDEVLSVPSVVEIQDAGEQLACMTCGHSTSCKHIKKVILDNLDNRIFDFTEVEVPLSIGDGIWVNVALDETPNKLAKIAAISQTHIFSNKPLETGGFLCERYLGLLSPGEGRRVLRAMLVECIRTWANYTKPTCFSTAHGIQAEHEWKMATESKKILNYWSIILWSCCLACQSYVNSDFGDDLVPDRPAAPTSWGGVPPKPNRYPGRIAGMSSSSDAAIRYALERRKEEQRRMYGIPSPSARPKKERKQTRYGR